MNPYRKGLFNGLLSGILWGADTTINGWVLLAVPFSLVDKRLVAASLLLAFFHDLFSALWLTTRQVIKCELKTTVSKLRNKSALFVMLAALFGGPIGMRAYLYAIDTIGAGYTASISALYPVVAAVLGAIILKDYLTPKGWFGLILSVLAITILGYSQLNSLNSNAFWGFTAACICAGGWAAESVICAYGMKEDVLPKEALFIRQWVSSIAYFFFIIFGGHPLFNIYSVISRPIIIIIAGLALIGTTSYLYYYQAIDMIGPVKATGMNVTYSVWAIIFSIFLLGGQFDLKLIMCSIMIIVGTVFISKE